MNKGKMSLIFGALAFLAFALQPYLLKPMLQDKSIGERMGQTAKDIREAIESRDLQELFDKSEDYTKYKNMQLATNASGFVLIALSLIFGFISRASNENKYFLIGALTFCLLAILFKLIYLSLGLALAIIIVFGGLIIFLNFSS